MTVAEVVEFVAGYASASAAPVRTQTTVTSVRQTDDGYHVATNSGDLRCRSLVLASGACNIPSVPALRQGVPATIESVTPLSYRSPDQLPDGGVLVVGASSTGVQLAEEIHRSGRPVTLSVGEHVRLPRTYRGRDVLWWMDASGVWNEPLRRDRRHQSCPGTAIAAAGRDAGACDPRPERPHRHRRRVGGPLGRRA